MAREIKLRRGTATEHETFTGAEGEVTVDTTNKTLRVHDGVTPGGIPIAKKAEIPSVPSDINSADYVIAYQHPTSANNYTWYRKYKSGWVEQGGIKKQVTSDIAYISLPVVMANSEYTISLTPYHDASSLSAFPYIRIKPTDKSFGIKTSATATLSQVYWRVDGIGV